MGCSRPGAGRRLGKRTTDLSALLTLQLREESSHTASHVGASGVHNYVFSTEHGCVYFSDFMDNLISM